MATVITPFSKERAIPGALTTRDVTVFGSSENGWTNAVVMSAIAKSPKNATEAWRDEWLKWENDPTIQGRKQYTEPNWLFTYTFETDNIKRDKRLAYRYIDGGHNVDNWAGADGDSGAPANAWFWESNYLGNPPNGPVLLPIPTP